MKTAMMAALLGVACTTQAQAENARWMARETTLEGVHACGHNGERYDVTITGDSFRALGMEKGDHFYGQGFNPDGSSRTSWNWRRIKHTIVFDPGEGPRKITITTDSDCKRVHIPISETPPPVQEISWTARGTDKRLRGARADTCLNPEIKWTFRVVNGGLHAVDDGKRSGFGIDKLNADGSGHTSSKNFDTSWTSTDVEAGTGPRNVRFRWEDCDVVFEP